MIKHYFKIAFRNLFKHKTQSIISIFGLMGGIVCFSVCTYFMRQAYSGEATFPDYARMAKVFDENSETVYSRGWKKDYIRGEELGNYLASSLDETECIARYGQQMVYTLEFDTESATKAYTTQALEVNGDFLRVYPARFLEGSYQQFADTPHAAVVTASYAKRIGGGESVLGRTFTVRFAQRMALKQTKVYTVVGVIEEYPSCTSFSLIAPEVLLKDEEVCYDATLLLRKGIDLSVMNERLNTLMLQQEEDSEYRPAVHLLSQMRLPMLSFLLLSIVTFLVFLVGVVNFLSFAIGSFLNRNREMSLRRMLGGEFMHLFALLFTELALTVGAAVLLAVALCEWLVPYVYSLLPNMDSMQQLFRIDMRSLLWHQLQYGACLLLLCLAVSLAIAWSICTRRSLADARRGSKTGSRHRLRNTMLGLQFLICMLFMYATGITVFAFIDEHRRMQEQREEIVSKDFTMELPIYSEYMLQEYALNIADSLRSMEWCEHVSYYKREWMRYWNSSDNDHWGGIGLYFVLPEYFEMQGIGVEESAVGEGYFCLINRYLQEYLAKDSVYTSFSSMDGLLNYPITGKIGYEERDIKIAFIALGDEKPNNLLLRLKAGWDVRQIRKDITRIIDPYLPDGTYFQFQIPGEKADHKQVLAFKISFTFFFVCAAICILITVLGLYGAITLDTNRRQKEIAIRKINGAKGKNILWIFGRLYVVLYVCTAVISTLIVYSLLISLNFGADYFNPLFYIAVLLIAAIIILVTVVYRLWRIVRLNPAACIKTE